MKLQHYWAEKQELPSDCKAPLDHLNVFVSIHCSFRCNERCVGILEAIQTDYTAVFISLGWFINLLMAAVKTRVQ